MNYFLRIFGLRLPISFLLSSLSSTSDLDCLQFTFVWRSMRKTHFGLHGIFFFWLQCPKLPKSGNILAPPHPDVHFSWCFLEDLPFSTWNKLFNRSKTNWNYRWSCFVLLKIQTLGSTILPFLFLAFHHNWWKINPHVCASFTDLTH